MTTSLEKPTTVKKGNSLTYSVEAVFPVSPETLWQKLTNIEELLQWDTMLLELTGTIGPNGKIKLKRITGNCRD